jgi:hypothetical protein
LSIIGNPIVTTNYISDSFSGDASTVAFTLSQAPASAASIAVYISGLYQIPTSAYSISGTTLTFTGAPPTGTNNITVLHLGVKSATLVPVNASVTPAMLNNANVIYWSASNNNIGIGNTTPTSLLTVTGTAALGNTSITGSLAVSTNTATIGTTLYSVANGNVGIGISSPAMPSSSYRGLEIYGNTNGPSLKLTNSTTGSGVGNGYDILVVAGGSDAYLWNRENAAQIFGTNDTERMRITSTGAVGIGITTPGSNIQIDSPASMGTGSATADILTVTNNNGVISGVAGDKLGIVLSAMSNLTDRRVGLYTVAGNSNWNNPDFAIWQTGQGIAFRETLRVKADSATLQFNSGYGSVATAYGCRAWLNYNAVTATIRGSGNVSSVVNNGTGDVSVIFATAMPDANFSWSISQQLNGTGNNDAGASSTARNIGTSAWAAGYVRILTMSNTNASQENPLVLTVAIFR